MTIPATTVDQNILPVQAYFNLDGSFNTFIGQGQPFIVSATESIGIINTSVTGTFYPTFTAVNTGQITSLSVTSSVFKFNPGTGELSAPFFDGTLNGTATEANNIAGGAASQLVYQTGSNTTGFVPNGTSGQFLLSNGTSAPSWSSVATSVTIVDQTSSSSTFYPLFYSATSGSTNTVDTSSTKLQYVPSTGTLKSTVFSGSGASLTNIPNSALTNASFTLGSTSIALGSTTTTIAGLVSVTSTTFVGALSGNATTATSATTATNANNVAITDNTSSVATWYPTIVSNTTGNLPETTSSTKLSFVPNTGILSATGFSGSGAGLTNISGSSISGTISLTTQVSGILPIANGGTGAATLTGYVKGNGTSAMTASTTIPNTDITGLGTMSTQNANAVAITGGTITGVTVSGYIPYTGASSAIDLNAQTVTNIAHLGLNSTVVPDILFRAYGDNNSTSRIAIRGYSSNASSSSMRIAKFRGTYAAPQAPFSGDSLGKFELAGYGTTSLSGYPQASYEGIATENWGATARGTKALFYVTPNTTITQAVALTLDQDKSATFASTVTATTFSGSGASLTSIPNSALVNSAITINSTSTSLGGSISVGTVTSVAATVPSFLSVSGSPITTSGTLALTYSGTALPIANGGTGLTTLTANYIPYGNGTSALQSSSTFTFNGSTLNAPQLITLSGSASAPAVAIGATNTGWYLTGSTLSMTINGTAYSGFNTGGLYTGGAIQFASAFGGSSDAFLYRDAANILAERNGVNAQTFRIYNTYTSSTSYENLQFDWTTTANTATISTQKGSGGGTARTLAIGQPLVISPGYTVATLPAGVVGMRAYVTDATLPTYLGILTGGGTVKCPVFYNGTAWVSA